MCHEKYVDMAKEFRISLPRISQIVGRVSKRKEALDEIMSKRNEVEHMKSQI